MRTRCVPALFHAHVHSPLRGVPAESTPRSVGRSTAIVLVSPGPTRRSTFAKSFATIDVSTGGSGKVSNLSAAPISSGPKTRASEVALALRTFAPAGTLSSVLNGAGASSRGASVIVIANVEPSVHAPE